MSYVLWPDFLFSILYSCRDFWVHVICQLHGLKHLPFIWQDILILFICHILISRSHQFSQKGWSWAVVRPDYCVCLTVCSDELGQLGTNLGLKLAILLMWCQLVNCPAHHPGNPSTRHGQVGPMGCGTLLLCDWFKLSLLLELWWSPIHAIYAMNIALSFN